MLYQINSIENTNNSIQSKTKPIFKKNNLPKSFLENYETFVLDSMPKPQLNKLKEKFSGVKNPSYHFEVYSVKDLYDPVSTLKKNTKYLNNNLTNEASSLESQYNSLFRANNTLDESDLMSSYRQKIKLADQQKTLWPDQVFSDQFVTLNAKSKNPWIKPHSVPLENPTPSQIAEKTLNHILLTSQNNFKAEKNSFALNLLRQGATQISSYLTGGVSDIALTLGNAGCNFLEGRCSGSNSWTCRALEKTCNLGGLAGKSEWIKFIPPMLDNRKLPIPPQTIGQYQHFSDPLGLSSRSIIINNNFTQVPQYSFDQNEIINKEYFS